MIARVLLAIRRNVLARYSTMVFLVFLLRIMIAPVNIKMLLAKEALLTTPSSGQSSQIGRSDVLLEPNQQLEAFEYGGFENASVEDNNRANILADSANSPKAPSSMTDSDEYDYVYNNSGVAGVADLGTSFFGGTFCNRMLPPDSNITLDRLREEQRTLLSLRFNCLRLFQESGLGTGNYVAALYSLRLAAATVGNVDIEFTCDDAEEQKDDLILPWITGWFPAPANGLKTDDEIKPPTVKEACSSYKSNPMTHMLPAMQWDFRRMAVALLGVPHSGHPAEAWAQENLWGENTPNAPMDATLQLTSPPVNSAPVYQNVELDDAVLHFRCGDLINSNHPSFGFMKFGSFSRHLPANVTTIGILTQPFNTSSQTRRNERGAMIQARCKKVVYAFVEHLAEKFPQTRITIRNDEKETIALTVARIVMAKYVVVAISSFSVVPAVASFGTSYIRKPDYVKAPNRWLLYPPKIEEVTENVKLVEEPRLMAMQCRRRWGQDGSAVLEWFKNYTLA